MIGLETEVLFAVSKLIEKLYKTVPNEVTHDFFAPTEIEHVYVIPTKASRLRKYFDGSIQEKLCKGIISLDYHPFSYNISNILTDTILI